MEGGSRAALMRRRCRVLCARVYVERRWVEGGGSWGLSWDRKQPPLDDETGALFVYLLGSGGEVLVALEETHKPTQSSLPGLTCGRCWKVNGYLESTRRAVTTWRGAAVWRTVRGRSFHLVRYRSSNVKSFFFLHQQFCWGSFCVKSTLRFNASNKISIFKF